MNVYNVIDIIKAICLITIQLQYTIYVNKCQYLEAINHIKK
jgi:hypothetical protein